MTTLPTDLLNPSDARSCALRAARSLYLDRTRAGCPAPASRLVALVYLRRKTHWPEPYAAGALDAAIEGGGP